MNSKLKATCIFFFNIHLKEVDKWITKGNPPVYHQYLNINCSHFGVVDEGAVEDGGVMSVSLLLLGTSLLQSTRRSWVVCSFLSRRPGGGWVLQHHPTDQTDQGEDCGAGLQSYAGILRTVFLWWSFLPHSATVAFKSQTQIISVTALIFIRLLNIIYCVHIM